MLQKFLWHQAGAGLQLFSLFVMPLLLPPSLPYRFFCQKDPLLRNPHFRLPFSRETHQRYCLRITWRVERKKKISSQVFLLPSHWKLGEILNLRRGGVPIMAQQRRIWLASIRTQVQSMALLSELTIQHCLEPWCRLQTQLRSSIAVAVV